ncbi:Mo-dependent nitrogenase C-terminal domain-containing protein [Okeania sp. SIO2C9]|uniref:Mo-dependent nitrogenase C-terminal domain-containing protein n=1 Tax=Okeania sp. SIO2C9 TaxID=2607791 RepID=UPI00345D9BCF
MFRRCYSLLLNGIFYSRQPKFAKKLCQLIPAQCPFARDINFWGAYSFKDSTSM